MSLATLLGGHAAPQDEQSADAYAGASIADLLGNSSLNYVFVLQCNATFVRLLPCIEFTFAC